MLNGFINKLNQSYIVKDFSANSYHYKGRVIYNGAAYISHTFN